MGYYNLELKHEAQKAIGKYKGCVATLSRFTQAEIARGVTLNPPDDDASPEVLEDWRRSREKYETLRSAALEAAEKARDLGVRYYSTSLGLLVRKINTKKFEKLMTGEIEQLQMMGVHVGLSEIMDPEFELPEERASGS
jgi:hypothetical protein